MNRLALLVVLLVFLSACSRSNNLFLGEVQAQVGTHTIRVTDCYRTSVPPPERLPDVNAQPAYSFTPCRDADIRVQAGELTVNGQSYGRISETDAVLVDHGKVSVNKADSRGQSSK
jgi:hypothetical protein